jgi:hypothetical protein
VAAAPLLDLAPAGAAPPLPPMPTAGLPAAGPHVLDLTRVIAGPVGTRMLGALGADVLRIDPPLLPKLVEAAVDARPGKRSALLDLRDAAGRATFAELLTGADVLVHGYCPGALAAHGLGGAELAAPSAPDGRRAVGVGLDRSVGRSARVRQPRPGGDRDRDRVPRARCGSARAAARAGARPRQRPPDRRPRRCAG